MNDNDNTPTVSRARIERIRQAPPRAVPVDKYGYATDPDSLARTSVDHLQKTVSKAALLELRNSIPAIASIVTDAEEPGDRVSAAKLLLDIGKAGGKSKDIIKTAKAVTQSITFSRTITTPTSKAPPPESVKESYTDPHTENVK